MATTKIHGSRQIQDLTITDTQIAVSANIATSKLADGANFAILSNYITGETPTGALNGVNVTFTLAFTPVSGKEEIMLNGLMQERGAGNDYTISGATITYLLAPLSTDKLRVSYWKV